MRRKRFFKYLLCYVLLSACIVVAFYGGKFYGEKDMIILDVKNGIDVFPKHHPMYGLPIIDFYSILIALEVNDYNLAQKRIFSLLLNYRYDLECRLHTASLKNKIIYKQLDMELNNTLYTYLPKSVDEPNNDD